VVNCPSVEPAGLLDHAVDRFGSAVGRPTGGEWSQDPLPPPPQGATEPLDLSHARTTRHPDTAGYLDPHMAGCLRLRHWAFRPCAGRAHQWSCRPHQLRTATYRVRGHRGEGSPSTWKRQPTPVDAVSECWSGACWAARSAWLSAYAAWFSRLRKAPSSRESCGMGSTSTESAGTTTVTGGAVRRVSDFLPGHPDSSGAAQGLDGPGHRSFSDPAGRGAVVDGQRDRSRCPRRPARRTSGIGASRAGRRVPGRTSVDALPGSRLAGCWPGPVTNGPESGRRRSARPRLGDGIGDIGDDPVQGLRAVIDRRGQQEARISHTPRLCR